MDNLTYFINFCQKVINAFAQLVEPVLDFCETSLYTTFATLGGDSWFNEVVQPIADLLKGTEFGDTPLLFALLGAGFGTYILYSIIKWFLDIIL